MSGWTGIVLGVVIGGSARFEAERQVWPAGSTVASRLGHLAVGDRFDPVDGLVRQPEACGFDLADPPSISRHQTARASDLLRD
jgi:hypothetical protein